MYKTKIDRWLIEHFIYEHHIKVVRLPQKLPNGVKVSEISNPQYNYLLVAKTPNKATALIDTLNDSGFVYSNKVVEGQHWYNSIINHKNKSFTFSIIWWCIILILGAYLISKLLVFLESDLFFELKKHTIELLQAGGS